MRNGVVSMEMYFLNNKSRNNSLHALGHCLCVVFSRLPHFLNENCNYLNQVLVKYPN